MTKIFAANKIVLIAVLLILTGIKEAYTQVAQEVFGKNRVQFHDDFSQWSFYEDEKIIVYWYGRSKAYAEKIIEIAKRDVPDVINLLEYKVNDKFEVLVFADYTDMKQSNLGIDQAFIHRSTLTKVEGSRIFVYYTGNQEDLQIQLREGITAVLLNSMFESENIRDVVRDAVTTDLPLWFRDGLVGFAGDIWNEYKDLEMRKLFLHSKKLDFDKLASEHPALVGNSMWYFIRLSFGRTEIANYLYISRINKSIEKSVLYVFGITYEELKSQWLNHFTRRYFQEAERYEEIGNKALMVPFRNKNNAEITDIKLFESSAQYVYAANDEGKVKIFLQNLEARKRKKLFKYGSRNLLQNPDRNYPVLYLKSNEEIVGIVYEKKDILYLREINLSTGKKQEQVLPNRYQRIFSVDPVDERYLLFTAAENEMKEIFIYDLSTRQSRKLTNDAYDNSHAGLGSLNTEKGYFFTSNRPRNNDTASVAQAYEQPFNVYFQSFDNAESFDTITLINDHVTDLEVVSDKLYAVIASGGVPNIYHIPSSLRNVQSALEPVTSEKNGVYSYDITSDGEIVYSTKEIVRKREQWVLKRVNESERPAGALPKTLFSDHKFLLRTKQTEEISSKSRNERLKNFVEKDTLKIDFAPVDDQTYLFQAEFGNSPDDYTIVVRRNETEVSGVDSLRREVNKNQIINPQRITPYRVSFRLSETKMDFDNSPLFGGLNTFAGTALEEMFTPVGILMKAEVLDLFEDYKIEGGIRVPLGFNGTEVYLLAEDRKKRLDKQIAFYRRGVGNTEQGELVNQIYRRKTVTSLGQATLSYPFDMFQAVKAIGTFRQDRTFYQFTNLQSLDLEPVQIQQLALRLEYVFDNSIDVRINIRNGIRAKVFVEAIKRLRVQLFDPFILDFNRGFITVAGVDFRTYQRILKHSIWANRIAGATSFGPEKILYITGGTDQWIFPRFDETGPAPPEPVLMQLLAPGIRGFQYNIRNGGSYALINSELRIPVFQYLFRRPLKSQFLNSFQLVGFADAGSAWFGSSPFSKDNPINTITVDNPSVSVTVNYFKDPFVFGYGFGARASLFGYFLRVDYGWGIETRVVQPPRLHLSFGFDF